MTMYMGLLPRITNYKMAKRKYENTPAYNGKYVKKEMNIRPYGSRSHCWYHIVKGRGYYTLQYGTDQRWSQPFVRWYKDGTIKIWYSNGMGQSMILETYNSALPNDLVIQRHKASRYLVLKSGVYRLSPLQKKPYVVRQVDGVWEIDPDSVHQEYKYSLCKKKVGKVTKRIQPFLKYIKIMDPMYRSLEPAKAGYRSWTPSGFTWTDVLRNRELWYTEGLRLWRQQCISYNYYGNKGYIHNGKPYRTSVAKDTLMQGLLHGQADVYEREPIGHEYHYDRYRYRYELLMRIRARQAASKRKAKKENK